MIDVHIESLIAIGDVPKRLPNRPHKSTIHRWVQRGSRGIRLETVLIGGRRYTSEEALNRFFADSTAAADGQPSISQSGITSPARKRALAKVNAELAREGL